MGAPVIEIDTGAYADARTLKAQETELSRIQEAAEYAADLGSIVNAGHGLHYHNVKPIAAISVFHALNIGHAMIARAIFGGLKEAVGEMRQLMREIRNYANTCQCQCECCTS